MKLSFVYLTALNLSFFTKAQTVTYCAWNNTLSCFGSGLCCSDNGAVCCITPTDFGFSWSWENLPSGSQGQVYSDACVSFIDERLGPGTQCWSGRGTRALAANWFHSPSHDESIATRETKCVMTDILTYTDDTGVRKIVKLPGTEEEVGKAVSLLRAQDWASLAEYPAAADLN